MEESPETVLDSNAGSAVASPAGSESVAAGEQMESVPKPLDPDHLEFGSRLRGAPSVLVCLDFDGTLAPIVDDPDDARITAANDRALDRLANAPGVTTAAVSGRGLADLRERVDASILAGNHGLELERDGSVSVHPVAEKRSATIAAVCSTLDVLLDPIPNVRIENKRLTGTVHVRGVPESARPIVERDTEAVVDRFAGDALERSPGKQIVEIGPSIPWGKGNAVSLVAADHPEDALVLYVGDDVTDESAFRAVEPDGIGIRVGDDRPTAASYRVDSPADVATLLESIADFER